MGERRIPVWIRGGTGEGHSLPDLDCLRSTWCVDDSIGGLVNRSPSVAGLYQPDRTAILTRVLASDVSIEANGEHDLPIAAGLNVAKSRHVSLIIVRR